MMPWTSLHFPTAAETCASAVKLSPLSNESTAAAVKLTSSVAKVDSFSASAGGMAIIPLDFIYEDLLAYYYSSLTCVSPAYSSGSSSSLKSNGKYPGYGEIWVKMFDDLKKDLTSCEGKLASTENYEGNFKQMFIYLFGELSDILKLRGGACKLVPNPPVAVVHPARVTQYYERVEEANTNLLKEIKSQMSNNPKMSLKNVMDRYNKTMEQIAIDFKDVFDLLGAKAGYVESRLRLAKKGTLLKSLSEYPEGEYGSNLQVLVLYFFPMFFPTQYKIYTMDPEKYLIKL